MKKQYKEPEEMIDHNGNLDTVSGLMSIFFAYNQKQADEGTTWSTWPDWELCLTSMKDDLHFEDDEDSDEIKAETMPKVPEPMDRPLSLGGLADRAGVEVSEEMEEESNDSNESSMSSLKERTEEWNEDIAEKEAATPPEEEDEADIDSAAVIEQELEREE